MSFLIGALLGALAVSALDFPLAVKTQDIPWTIASAASVAASVLGLAAVAYSYVAM